MAFFFNLYKNRSDSSSMYLAMRDLFYSNPACSLCTMTEFHFIAQITLSYPNSWFEVTFTEAEWSQQKPARHSALLVSGQPERSTAEDANVNESTQCSQRYICSANVNSTAQSKDHDYTGLRGLCMIWLCGYSPTNGSVD